MFELMPQKIMGRAVYLRDDAPTALGGPFAFSWDKMWGPVITPALGGTEAWRPAIQFTTRAAAEAWLAKVAGPKRTYAEVVAMDLEDWK